MAQATVRSPWRVTWSVWRALFLRDFLTRVTKDRLAWFWMLFEPIAVVVIMVVVRTVALGQVHHIAGADYVPWSLVGLLGFFLFRENMLRAIGSIAAHRTLFAYRQVQPVDPVLVRCFLEGMLKTFIFMLFILGSGLLGIELFPENFPLALFGWLSLWLLGVGVAVTLAALSALVPEVGNIARISSLPLLIVSGVLFPLHPLPHELQQYLLLNPIVHALEILRAGFFAQYAPVKGVSLTYLWYWILGLLSLGLMIQVRFKLRLRAS